MRNSYLMELPLDLWTDEPTNCKCVLTSHTKVSRSEKPHWKRFIKLVPSSTCCHSWVSCWSEPSAALEHFCVYSKILIYSRFNRGECFSKWPLCTSSLFTGASFSKALSSWSECTSVFSWNTENGCYSVKLRLQSSVEGTQTVLCNLGI